MKLAERFRAGDIRALARLITLLENDETAAEAALAALADLPVGRVIGLTGPPGVGKSSLAAALTGHWRAEGRRVGMLAVDPSSPLSGGAALGDRVRLAAHATDAAVFVRSMGSRGATGGLAAAAARAARLIGQFGFDPVLLETVGVGQGEMDIVGQADCVVLLQAPGGGDDMQAIKAGVLEVADIIVVTKADLPGAHETAARLRALALPPAGPPPPVMLASAHTGSGIAEVAAALLSHMPTDPNPALTRQRLVGLALARLRRQLQANPRLAMLAADVAAGRLTADEAVDRLLPPSAPGVGPEVAGERS